ncbi:MAG: hypothetical protein PF518_07790 [Spirochaetaceae bacterium]|nr:hypothetical protein [Spirochaetaceae bacterium]
MKINTVLASLFPVLSGKGKQMNRLLNTMIENINDPSMENIRKSEHNRSGVPL